MSDTPIQPSSGSVTAAGVVAAMAMSLTFVPVVGAVTLAGAAPALTSGTATVITPTAGAVTLAGVAPGFAKPTVTAMTPTVASLTLAGVASSVLPVNQAPPGSVSSGALALLWNSSVSGTRFYWPGGKALFVCNGTFSGATVTLNILGPDNATLQAVGTSTTITAAAAVLVELPPCTVQASVASGSPSALYATLTRVPTEIG
jgi:hypothetical protein